MKKINLKINKMHCSSCSIRIDGDLEETTGVLSAMTDFHKARSVIEYDETKTSPEQIIEVVKNAGYEAELQ